MTEPTRLRVSWPAFVAAGLLSCTAFAARAGVPDADAARVDVVGQLPLRDACPEVDVRDLAEQLVPAWEAAARPSSVEVNFRVQGRHVYDVVPATGSPRVFHQIRRTVHGLRCDGGDDQAHGVRLVVRFVDGADPRAPAIAVVDDADAADGGR